MIVGSAGHIDHGKTSLVRKLTGIDTDRLKEEKARGISIDLGFAYLPRPAKPGEAATTIGFVDVPGHEGLVHNMLAGATGIDFVLLVVAADDGVMPQTLEHVSIVDLLGLDRGVVALNKCDLVSPERIAQVTRQIKQTLATTGLRDAEIIPVSAHTGFGLDILQAKLDDASDHVTHRASNAAFRLAVDRCFTLPGQGTVVTGTALSGTVNVDDTVIVSPGGIEARVRSIHAQNQSATQGHAGQRCALVLAGPKVSKDTVKRGSVVTAPELHAPTQRLDVRLRLLPSERRALGQWTPVRVHHAASETGGRVVILRETPLAPSETEFAQLVLEHPIAACAGDRFILRDTTSSRTIGGGTIIDLRAPERRRRTPERRAVLEALALPDPDDALLAVLDAGPGWINLAAFLRDRGLPASQSQPTIDRLNLTFISADGTVMRRDRWRSFAQDMTATLEAFHKANPDLIGLGVDKLRLQMSPRFPVPLFTAATGLLIQQNQIRIDRAWVRLPTHEVKLSPQEEQLWSRIMLMLADEERFRPPRVRDIARDLKIDEKVVRHLSRLAARRGDVEEIATDHYFLVETVTEMADIARALATLDPQGFSVIQFRDRLDNGRKVAIQILEFFDRHGLTMRRGDLRRINVHRATLFSKQPTPAAAAAPEAGRTTEIGGVPFPVGRPDFKSGWGRQTVPGGFDSHPPPPRKPKEARS